LPIELIKAMPSAAAEPVRKPVGRVQKVALAAYAQREPFSLDHSVPPVVDGAPTIAKTKSPGGGAAAAAPAGQRVRPLSSPAAARSPRALSVGAP